MEVKEMVQKYNISKFDEGKIRIANMNAVNRDNALELIKKSKTEILEYIEREIAEKKAAADMRQAKINAIEGLKELKEVIRSWARYDAEFERRMNDECLSSIAPKKPVVTVDEVSAKYPRAAAYIKAENMSYASNYTKSECGREALEKIINGYDYNEALKEADEKWSAYCTKHIFD